MQPLQRAARHPRLAIEFGRCADRTRQHDGVEEKADERPGRHLPAGDTALGDPQEQDNGGRGDELNGWLERCVYAALRHAEPHDLANLRAVAMRLRRFVAQIFDDRQHTEILFGNGDGSRLFLLDSHRQ